MGYRVILAFLATFLFSVPNVVQGQDYHFSLVELMPTWVNPANTGNFYGTARVGGIYRDQWGAILSKSYQTPGVYVDAPLFAFGKKKTSWISAGGILISDAAGLTNLTSTSGLITVGYHTFISKTKRSSSIFSVGLEGGMFQQRADLSSDQLILGDEQATSFGGKDLGLLNSPDRAAMLNATGFDLGLGVAFTKKFTSTDFWTIGISGSRITQPEEVSIGKKARKNTLIKSNFQFSKMLSSGLKIEPTALVQSNLQDFEGQLQAMVGVGIGKNKKRDFLKAGLGARLPARFIYPMVGLDYGDFKVAASFDISTNSIQKAQGFQSGFELAAQYVIKYYKKPKVKQIVICPQI